MTLRMNCARENFNAGDPGALYLRPRPVCPYQLARRNTRLRDSLRQGAHFIIARSQCISCRPAHAKPQDSLLMRCTYLHGNDAIQDKNGVTRHTCEREETRLAT